MVSQDWLRLWFGAVRQQVITWAIFDPDLCRHMVSLGHNALIQVYMYIIYINYTLLRHIRMTNPRDAFTVLMFCGETQYLPAYIAP